MAMIMRDLWIDLSHITECKRVTLMPLTSLCGHLY